MAVNKFLKKETETRQNRTVFVNSLTCQILVTMFLQIDFSQGPVTGFCYKKKTKRFQKKITEK